MHWNERSDCSRSFLTTFPSPKHISNPFSPIFSPIFPQTKQLLTMPESRSSHSETDAPCSEMFVHTLSHAGRVQPSASRWNSIELDYNLIPQSSTLYESLSSKYSKSYDFNLVIVDRRYFKRFVYISLALIFIVITLILLLNFLPRKPNHHGRNKDLTLAVQQALTFFDAQKSGNYPKNSLINFRGDSGLNDGNSSSKPASKLVGGFYDSGNNVKFSYPTAYTVTLLSWSVIEYHQKYEDIGELDHVMDIIKWGSDYLLKLFVLPNATSDPTILYSQVGTTINDTNGGNNDINCWQRPEDMNYERHVSVCNINTAADLAAEIVAALSAASLVFKQDINYSKTLSENAEKLFQLGTSETLKQESYTTDESCGNEARVYYNSTGYEDELVWGGTWLFYATGNSAYLQNVTNRFDSVEKNSTSFDDDDGVFYWNNKLSATALLLTRLRYLHDVGYPYESVLQLSSNKADLLMCSYLFDHGFHKTPGGLILLRPDYGAPLQYAATASFLSKLYSDYLQLMHISVRSCKTDSFSVQMLNSFSNSQVNYILGDNPMKMSYVVGFGDQYPTHVHHRAASIPYDGQTYSCAQGQTWLQSPNPNPNILLGAMVAGPDQLDNFLDARDKPWFTQPSIATNAGLVAALIALHDPSPRDIDQTGIFQNIRVTPPAI